MTRYDSVRCEAPHFPTIVVAMGLIWFTGLVVLAVQKVFLHRDGLFTLIFLCGLLALTVCIALIRSRYVVRAVEFTTTQVRLESRARVRTASIADVREVRVSHSGNTEGGYQKTTLLLIWRDGASRWFVCNHDPSLGKTLLRLLPSHVALKEQWDELQEPMPPTP